MRDPKELIERLRGAASDAFPASYLQDHKGEAFMIKAGLLEAASALEEIASLNKANSDGWAEAVKINWQCLAERDAARAENVKMRASLEHIAKRAKVREDGRDLTAIRNDFAAIHDALRDAGVEVRK